MKAKIHYAWVIAGVTFVVLLAGAGVRSTPSLLMVRLEAEFGWSRALISTAVAVNILLFGLIGPFAAGLMNRIGLRRAVPGSLLIVSLAVLASSRMNEPWQLLLLWELLVGIGTGATSMVLPGWWPTAGSSPIVAWWWGSCRRRMPRAS